MFWMIISGIVFGLIGLGIYLYFLSKGRFEDEENIKYQLFREDNPEN